MSKGNLDLFLCARLPLRKPCGATVICPFGIGITLLIMVLFFIPQKKNTAPLPQGPSSIPAEVNYATPELALPATPVPVSSGVQVCGKDGLQEVY